MTDKKKIILVRVYLVYLLTLLFAVLILAKIIYIQFVVGSKYRVASEKRHYGWVTIAAKRGSILSADGVLLSGHVPYYNIFFDPLSPALPKKVVLDNIEALGDSLHKHFGVDKKTFVRNIKNIVSDDETTNRNYSIAKGLTWHEKELIRTFPIFNRGWLRGGIITAEEFIMKYTHGTLARRTIGMVDRSRGISFGLSHAYDSLLAGSPGHYYALQKKGSKYPLHHDSLRIIEPVNGFDLVSTIDLRIQDIAENELKKQMLRYEADSGIIVIMEVQTGHVKAISNLRNNHNGTFSEVLNYAVSSRFDPGSTMKLPSFMVAFEDGFINIDDTIDCGRGYIRKYNRIYRDVRLGGHGRISVRDVFKHSSNVGTTKIFDKYYNKTDKVKRLEKIEYRRPFIDGLYRMRLNKPLGVNIDNEPDPVISYDNASDNALLQKSIGYEVNLTPLQMLAFYNAVANNGTMVKPIFAKEVRDGEKVIKRIETEVLQQQIASPRTIAFARDLLEAVVTEGSARTIRNTNGYTIAGKTGTALVNHPEYGYNHQEYYNSSFAGYFPADNPKYSAIVYVFTPNIKYAPIYGGVTAAPVLKNVADFIYAIDFGIRGEEDIDVASHNPFPVNMGNQREVTRLYQKYEEYTVPDNPHAEWVVSEEKGNIKVLKTMEVTPAVVPRVVGMSLKDAIYMLENIGLNVVHEGAGNVRRQSLKEGDTFNKGDVIELILTM